MALFRCTVYVVKLSCCKGQPMLTNIRPVLALHSVLLVSCGCHRRGLEKKYVPFDSVFLLRVVECYSSQSGWYCLLG